MIEIAHREELSRLLRAGEGPHYVYVLRQPDGVSCYGGTGTPFYVGIGQSTRLFSHEEAAQAGTDISDKADEIRRILSKGRDIVRTIDSFHEREPWSREAELIHEIGRKVEGLGPLLNAQTYSLSEHQDGVDLRKYAAQQRAAGGIDAIPKNFKLAETRLTAGPNPPKSLTSVMGKVYSTAKANPGVTGSELVHLLAQQDFSANKSAYTQTGQACASWFCGYIEGAYFRRDKLHLQDYRS